MTCNKVMTRKLFRREVLFLLHKKLLLVSRVRISQVSVKPTVTLLLILPEVCLKFTFFSLLHSTFSPKNDILHARPGAG